MTPGLVGLLTLVLAQEPSVFRTQVELVYVDVFATKKDAPVSGLESRDFRVKDNGVEQRVEVVERALVPTTAVLALDTSASVAGGKLVHLKEAGRVFLAGLGERDEAALVTFSHKLVLREDATRDEAAIVDALDRVRARGGTALIDALYVCLKRRWGTGRPLVVLFTDGQDSASWLENDDVLEAARESSALLHVVGTEPLPTRVRSPLLPFLPSQHYASGPVEVESGYVYLLRRAAETTGGAYWPVESATSLPDAFLRILEAANTRYVLRYEPQGVRRVGRHRVKVSVRRRGVDVHARQEYVVPADTPD
jgi:VWFA-related protein